MSLNKWGLESTRANGSHKLMPGEKILLLVPESGRFSYGTVLLSVV